MTLEIEQFICRIDNFGILVHDKKTGETALIDAPEERAILAAVERMGWRPSLILNTHHHRDHVEANLALKARFGLTIVGPGAEADRIPGIERGVKEGDRVRVGSQEARVIETPGHTAGHIMYHFVDAGILFTGDTLFALGCGRLFECPASVMFNSLRKLASLPPESVIYCGHEYTRANADFALTVDPMNAALHEYAREIDTLARDGKPTLPSTLERELMTNPFLRWGAASVRRHLGMEKARDEEVFARLRQRKDAM